eukprot:1189268-Prorocentrum_minimum.AAC.3
MLCVAPSTTGRVLRKLHLNPLIFGHRGWGEFHPLLWSKTLLTIGGSHEQVTLVDAAETPGGLSRGWRTAKGRAVEAGIKGFWCQILLSSPNSVLHTKLCT